MAKSHSSLSQLLQILDSVIIEYALLDEDTVGNFRLSSIRCLIREANLNLVNKYYIIVADKFGSHCVDYIVSFEYVRLRFDYWKRYLELGHRKVVEYSFPDVFPVRDWILDRGKNGKT